MIDHARPARSRFVRAIYAGLGFLFLGLGIVGIFVPLLPTTINLILAAFFFFRSNDRMYRWLITHPRFGPTLRDYRAGLGIPRRVKAYAVGAVMVTFTVTILVTVDSIRGRVVMITLAAAIIAFILTRPTRERQLAARG
ncbi:MAG: YbaN family protein [Actinomycetota bacterium]|nr:YbaN family protein [Actinomycetota bacterium]